MDKVGTEYSNGSGIVHAEELMESSNMDADELLYSIFSSDVYKHDGMYRILTYTRKAKKAYNQIVRGLLYEGREDEDFIIGERLVADETFYEGEDVLLYNNENLVVTDIQESETMVLDSPMPCYILKLLNNFGKEKTVRTLSEEGWELLEIMLDPLVQEARSTRDGALKSKIWRTFYENKGKFAKIELPYAMTTHKAQGSTLSIVLMDTNDILGAKDGVTNLVYTAVTRPSNLLILL
jgi:hypothetical protein